MKMFKPLAMIILASTLTYCQNRVTGNIQSIPFQTGVDSAEVILTDSSTHKQYAALTDSLGNFSLSVPSGSYSTKVKAINYFLYNDSMLTARKVSGNYDGLDVQLIENLRITDTNYYKNILEEFKNIGEGTPYGGYSSASRNVRWKDSLIPIPLYEDSVDAPTGWTAQADSAIAELSGPKTWHKILWSIQPINVSVGVSIKYVPNDQMPTGGVGAPGFTNLSLDNNGDYLHATCYINTDFNDTSNVRVVVRRELERALGFHSYSPDPNSDMDETGANYTDTLRHDDGLVLAIQYTLKNWQRTDPDVDSAVTSIDLPPGSPRNSSPTNSDTLANATGLFTWSGKPGTKPVTYSFTIFGNGKSITKATTDTFVVLDSASVFSLAPFSKYGWTVSASDGLYAPVQGDTSYVFTSTLTGVNQKESNIPRVFALEQNYPNPFNPTTTISFTLPSRSIVSLKVFDILGREVSTIVSGELQAGSYTQQWNAVNMSSGVYFYRLQAGTYSDAKKLLLLK